MRTTLDIEDDVMLAIKELARRRATSAGRVLSDLARRALTQPMQPMQSPDSKFEEPAAIYGFRPFPHRGGVVTNEQVDRLRDDDGI